MKNVFLKSSFTCILIFLVSCSSESTTELNVLDENQISEKIIEHPLNELQFDRTNNANIERIKKWYKSKINENLINKNSKFDLDFKNVNSYKIDDKEFIIVNQKNINQNNSENNGVSFLKDNGVIRPLFHVKTINFSEKIKKIEYFSLSGKSMMSVTFNEISKEIKFNSSPINKKSSFGILKSGFKCFEGSYGQAIVDCMEDVYSKRGWTSLFVSISTAFVPQVAIGMAALCAYDNYPTGSQCYESF